MLIVFMELLFQKFSGTLFRLVTVSSGCFALPALHCHFYIVSSSEVDELV